MAIRFFEEDIKFSLAKKNIVKAWIKSCIENEGYTLKELNFIFCSDAYLLNINEEYLGHNTYTDIVTFDNSEKPGSIQGDIFISIDRVKENASIFKVPISTELHRVIIHGTLHLLGYKDKSKSDILLMREKENEKLDLLEKSFL